jgi:hypothetical protein
MVSSSATYRCCHRCEGLRKNRYQKARRSAEALLRNLVSPKNQKMAARHSWRRGPVMVVGYVIGGSMTLLVGKSRIESAETIEAVSCIATASPLLFDVLLQPSGMGSSGIDLFRYGFRLSYGR